MESQTKAVFDFMQVASRIGLLDGLLTLAGSMISPDAELDELLGNLEDRANEVDLKSIDEKLGEMLVPVMRALTDEEVAEGMKVLLSTFNPVIKGMMEAAGGDMEVFKEMLKDRWKSILSMKTTIVVLARIILKVTSPRVDEFFKDRAGDITGNGINSFCTMINGIEERDPEIISGFMSNLFDTVDSNEFRKTVDTLVGPLLKRLPIVRWTVSTLMGRTKKNVVKR